MERVDAAIIGGGVIGLACAAELARVGVDVALLEKLPSVGQASSSRANGGFRAQFASACDIEFSLFSIDGFEALERETGSLSMKQNGYLLVTGSEEGERGLAAAREVQVSLGADVQWLSTAEIREMAPFVRSEGVRAAAFHGRDGFLDPAGLVTALASKASHAGATILTEAPVTAVDRQAEGFVLRHAGGRLAAKVVVNAAGARAREVAVMAGTDVPVEPVRRNLALFLDPDARASAPMCVDLDAGVLVRPEGSSGWVVAYSDPGDPPGTDTTLDPRFLEQLAERVPNRFPFLSELPVDPGWCWAGLYPETPDHHAIVGHDPAVPGLVHCVGFGGHGLMHAPAAGRAVAELITSGRCDTFDLHPLRPSRFEEGDPTADAAVF